MHEPTDPESLLLELHARQPGMTTQSMAAGRTSDGRSSYALLADVIPPDAGPAAILDLACGDGYLLEILARRLPPPTRLIGVDMSGAELDLARQRLRDFPVELRQARAQDLPLADASVDYVLCHLALMLMTPLDPALGELARVLKPGGTFGAIIGSMQGGDATFGACAALVREHYLRETGKPIGSGDARTLFGDPRTYSEHGPRALFADHPAFAAPTVAEIEIRYRAPIGEIAARFLNPYPALLLSEAGRAALEGRLRGTLAERAEADGTVRMAHGVRQITCRRV